MRSSLRYTFVALVVCIVSISCGGSGPNTGRENALPDPQSHLDTPALGIPSLANLPEPTRELSIIGPGWFEIGLADSSQLLVASSAASAGGNVVLDGASGLAYAVFGVWGFDGDNGPTSARIAVESIAGEYWVAFSDYLAGRWQYTGPFTASAEVEIPHVDAYTSPSAFISEKGYCYVAILAPQGSTLTVDELELGVHGGEHSPYPPKFLKLSLVGTADAVQLHWGHSGSAIDPDFDGYIVERAPLTYGQYARLTPEPISADYYLDDTVASSTVYRYRVAAVDVSGNQSLWIPLVGMASPSGDLDPVAVLDLPRGPLYGPVGVSFDMSGSYHSGGETIDTYALDFGFGMPPYIGPSDTVMRTMQPGCYTIQCTVTSLSGDSTTTRMLRVYPTWQDNPVTIAEPDPLWPRSMQFRAATDPANGEAVFFWYDTVALGLVAWRQGQAPLRLPIYESPVLALGEPMLFEGCVMLPVRAGTNAFLACLDETGFEWAGPRANLAVGDSVATTIALTGEPGVVYLEEFAGDYKIRLAYGLSQPTTLINPVDATTIFDAVYSAMANTIYVAYTKGADTYCVSLPLDGSPPSVEVVTDKVAEYIDVEADPISGYPAVTWHYINQQHFRQQETPSTWGPDVLVNGAVHNRLHADLVITDNGTFCANAEDSGALGLHEFDGVSWSQRNSVDYSGTFSGTGIAIAPLAGGNFALADIADDAVGHFGIWNQGGTYTHQSILGKSEYIGMDLHGAGGSPDLHAVWVSGEGIEHFTSPDGVAWSEKAALPVAMSPEIAADSTGEVFLSYVSAGTGWLDLWDGAAWVNLDSHTASAGTQPVLSPQPFRDRVYWLVSDDDAVPPEVHSRWWQADGTNMGYTPDVVHSPVWCGVINHRDQGKHFVLASTLSIVNSNLGFYAVSSGILDEVCEVRSDYMGSGLVSGRLMDTSSFSPRATTYMKDVYWFAQGPEYAPVRIVHWGMDPIDITSLEYSLDDSWAYVQTREQRRSISAGYAWGGSAVALIASYDGQDAWFEWDNFGDWENLPVPSSLESMSLPELIVGRDGRWHIVYRHLFSGQILCLSTL